MKFKKAYCFDDVLIIDKFSSIASRKNVDTSVDFLGSKLQTALISSNMACVTEAEMAQAMVNAGGIGALHRFMPINDNVDVFKNCPKETIVSCGIGDTEIDRAITLFQAGASRILLDVAQGANYNVIETVRTIREKVKDNAAIIVGNFSNAKALETFLHKLPCHIDMVKIGIGGGSACITRKVTGCGLPTFASILDCSSVGLPIIADGGIRGQDDFCKALAAGATAVMCGRLFCATNESSADTKADSGPYLYKKYSGSASEESYEKQGKTANHRTPEGESYWLKNTGSTADVVQKFNAGLRSCMGLNGALTIKELQDNVEFVEVSQAGAFESIAHGKT